ncbi:MAG: hypothetical protein E6767_01245 [Dysgonomonas sp.]|nr:hypothetical protein [Dysgonomonas sp.]
MKIVLGSFANKAISYGFSRLEAQAKSFELFDKIYLFTEKDLTPTFKKDFKRYMIPYTRGFGYWCWKPQIILQLLDKIDEGDILLYMDIGSHLNIGGKKRLLEYIKTVDESETGILAFRSPEHLESKLTKMDIFEYFGVADNKFYTNTTQIEDGHIFIKKSPFAISFIKEWMKAYCDDFSLATDSPSRKANFGDFMENRHDQSLFSILGKKYGITTLSTDETYSTDWSTMTDYPFQAKRDKAYKNERYHKHRFKLEKLYRLLWKIRYK